jgi:hypothetical protein
MTEIQICQTNFAESFTGFIREVACMGDKFFDATPLVTFTKGDKGAIATISDILINGTRQAVKTPAICKVISTVDEEDLNIPFKVARVSYTADGEPIIVTEPIA